MRQQPGRPPRPEQSYGPAHPEVATELAQEFALRFLIPPYEMTVFADGRAIIKGTSDTGIARSLYARYVG